MSEIVLAEYLELAENQRDDLPGATYDWLQAQRQQALVNLQQFDLPWRQEAWKYTRLTQWQSHHFAQVPLGESCIKISAPELPERVICRELNDLEVLPRNQLQSILQKTNSAHGFAALNGALWQQGICLIVPDDMVISQPIEIVINGLKGQQHLRHIIKLGRNSQVAINISYQSAEAEASFHNIVMQIELSENSQCELLQTQQESAQTFHFAQCYIDQAAQSRFKAHYIALGAKQARQEIQVNLQGEGAECDLQGLFVSRHQQHLDQMLHINHLASHTRSKTLFKGLASEQSRGVFTGRIRVAPEAAFTEAHLHNPNLLLSHKAEIDSQPQLEIDQDEVQCSHGSTVGQLDKEALFYLQSRGLTQDLAQRLLLKAFADEILMSVPKSLQNFIGEIDLLSQLPIEEASQHG